MIKTDKDKLNYYTFLENIKPCKIQKKYLTCAWKLSLNAGKRIKNRCRQKDRQTDRQKDRQRDKVYSILSSTHIFFSGPTTKAFTPPPLYQYICIDILIKLIKIDLITILVRSFRLYKLIKSIKIN